ncbi:uncharacterized protein LOC141531672 isoform X2 [Cotesia typhae]|uniref:uncharacterized protein LOC141531672 isoform X2 n=1 Tax=Cotesia typhae TaxID=2053667 RepID=UPI003D694AF8
MEELLKLTLLDCIENTQYELKVTQEIFDRAKTDTMFATKLLEFCKNEVPYRHTTKCMIQKK